MPPKSAKEAAGTKKARLSVALTVDVSAAPAQPPPPSMGQARQPTGGATDKSALAPRRHASRTSRLRRYLTNPLRVATCILWAVATVAALAIDVVVDVFQGHHLQFPPLPFIATSVGLNVVTTGLVLFLGRLTKRGFAVFQPFAGGQTFALMQAAGYCMAVVAATSKALLVQALPKEGPGSVRYGAYAVLGCFSALAQVLLISSLLFFTSPRTVRSGGDAAPAQTRKDKTGGRGSTGADAHPSWWNIAQPPARDYAFISLCCFILITSSAVAEAYPRYRPVNVAALACFAFISVVVVSLVGRSVAPSYGVFYGGPSPLSLSFVRFIGNALLLLFVSGCVFLMNAKENSPASWHLGCALIAVTAVCTHLLLLRLTQSLELKEATEAAAAAVASVDPSSPLLHEVIDGDMKRVEQRHGLSGAAMATAVAAVLAAGTFGISSVLSYYSVGARKPSAGAPPTYVTDGLRQVQALLVILAFALPPTTHLQGRMVFGTTFEVWQPFKGNLEFVCLQAAGWASYAFAIFFATLHASETAGHFHFLLLGSFALLLSQLFLHVSLHLFIRGNRDDVLRLVTALGTWSVTAQQSPASAAAAQSSSNAVGRGKTSKDAEETPAQTESASGPAGDRASSSSMTGATAADASSAIVSAVMNGEMILALVFGVVSVIISVVCDAVTLYHAEHKIGQHVPLKALLGVASVLGLVSTPCAHMSMRDRMPVVNLFSTSGGFYLNQGFAWSAYAFLSSLTVRNFVTNDEHYFACSSGYIYLEHTIHAVMFLVPLVAVLVSDFFETGEQWRRKRDDARRLQSAEELFSLFSAKSRDSAEQERVAALLQHVAGPHHRLRGVMTALSAAKGGTVDEEALARVLTSEEQEAQTRAIIVAAGSTTSIMCLACILAFGGAAMIAATQPVVTLFCGVTGLLLLSLSCLLLQYVYGTKLHRQSGKYSLFMPFAGGRSFVAWQAVGWFCYSVVAIVVIACLVERQGTRLMFATMCVGSVAAQLALLYSIPKFDPTKNERHTFLGRNAEGLLTVIIILGAFAVARAYDLIARGRVTSNASALVPAVLMSIAMCLTIPMGLLFLQRQAERYGVSPFALLESDEDGDDDDEATGSPGAWHCRGASGETFTSAFASPVRGPDGTTEAWHPHSPRTVLTPRSAELGYHSRQNSWTSPMLVSSTGSPLLRRNGSSVGNLFAAGYRHTARSASYSFYVIALSYAMSILLAIFLVLLLPFALVFLAYSYWYGSAWTLEAGLQALKYLVACFAAVVVIPILVQPVARRSQAMRRVHSALCCWAIYSIPTYTVMAGLSPPAFVSTRGSWLFSINMCGMACLSLIPYVHLGFFIFTIACCCYFIHFHFYVCWYEQHHPFVTWQCVCDLISAVFWVWYVRRYAGQPHITGRFQSRKASLFFQKYFFEGTSDWFSTKIVAADLYVLPQEKGIVRLQTGIEEGKPASSARKSAPAKGSGKKGPVDSAAATPAVETHTERSVVSLRNPRNQYLFSFHPHGVFPGTAMYVPKTAQWESKIGCNDENFVSTHCADVVFSVPIMREFPMCLGSMSVSRAGIEHSIRSGNSPLVVTGGQSEMLLTRMSKTEIHLVCHHLGFVKIAMRNNIPLVPIISFSECNVLDNLHCLPTQRWFLKRVGFPFPTLPIGVARLPLPTATPITVVVGPPLWPLPGRENCEDQDCLEEMRVRYFEHVEYLFYRHRASAGYPDIKLYLHYGVDDNGVLAEPPAAGVDVTKDYVFNHENSAVRRALAANREKQEAKLQARLAAEQAKEAEQTEMAASKASKASKKKS